MVTRGSERGLEQNAARVSCTTAPIREHSESEFVELGELESIAVSTRAFVQDPMQWLSGTTDGPMMMTMKMATLVVKSSFPAALAISSA